MNGYRNEKMNLSDVNNWLIKQRMAWVGGMLMDMFEGHVWNEDGLMRTDVIKDIFEKLDSTGLLFRQLQCDVVTYMFTTPVYEAHVD
jgi:hypothetical protein